MIDGTPAITNTLASWKPGARETGLAIKDADRSRFWQIAMGVGALIGLLIAGNLVLLFFYLRDRRGKRPTVTAAVPMVEPS